MFGDADENLLGHIDHLVFVDVFLVLVLVFVLLVLSVRLALLVCIVCLVCRVFFGDSLRGLLLPRRIFEFLVVGVLVVLVVLFLGVCIVLRGIFGFIGTLLVRILSYVF